MPFLLLSEVGWAWLDRPCVVFVYTEERSCVPLRDMPDQLWREVVVSRMVAVSGGYGGPPQTVESRDVLYGGRASSFVRISKGSYWLLKTCGGKQCQRGGLRRTKIVEEIRKQIEALEEGQHSASLAALPDVLGDAQGPPSETAVAVGDDPMLQLADLGEAVASPVAKRKRMRREKVRSSGHVQSLELPERLGEPQLRTVRAFRSGKNILWIHEDDVPWLCTYIAAELATGGVGPIEDADEPFSEEYCPENSPPKPIKGRKCRVRWDFNGAWEGIVMRGPKKGTQIVCKVSSMTADKWARVSAVHHYNVDYENADNADMKTAALHFLQLHLHAAETMAN